MPNAKSTVLATMTGKTYTLGWDVLVAYNAASVNELFAAQYVQNVREGADYPPITTLLTVLDTDVQVTDLVMGPPLISFAPGIGDQQAIVTLPFVSGSIELIEKSGDVTYVTGMQQVGPGDDFQLELTVPLDMVSGSVSTQQVVSVNLAKSSRASANLLPGTTAASYLGRSFTEIFANSAPNGLSYRLGGFLMDSSEGLIPTSFKIRTQVYPGTNGPDGAVLLFVATKYNEGEGNFPGEDFPYLIPDGNGCALIVASRTFFGNILAPYYNRTMDGAPTFSVRSMSSTPGASFMVADGGTLAGPSVSGSWTSGSSVGYTVWSGSCGFDGRTGVAIPYDGWTFEPEGDQLSISWNGASFSQQFAGLGTMRNSVCHSSDVTLTLDASMAASLGVDAKQQVSLQPAGSPEVDISFTASGAWPDWIANGNFRDGAAAQLASKLTPMIAGAMNASIPDINIFATGHLLFPSANALSYSSAHLPGDLAVFGQIAPRQTAFTLAPLQVALGPEQTQQFAASEDGQIEWSVFPRLGQMSASGLYTAPFGLAATASVVVTATDAQGDVATAVVTCVPSTIAVTPSFSVILAGSPQLQLEATALGGAMPTWSISPDDGSAGSIGQSGSYTPPTAFPTSLVTATVTASAAGFSASTLLCLADVSIGISIAPTSAALGTGSVQQFTATPATSVSWTLQPAIGSIDANGCYTAPSSLAEPATVLVIACIDGAIYGFAPIYLYLSDQPPSEGGMRL